MGKQHHHKNRLYTTYTTSMLTLLTQWHKSLHTFPFVGALKIQHITGFGSFS